MTVNLKNFGEQYEAKLASKKWHLERGSVRNIGNWRDSTIKSKQIQTMELEANKRYYKENKFDKWFKQIEMLKWKMKQIILVIRVHYPYNSIILLE